MEGGREKKSQKEGKVKTEKIIIVRSCEREEKNVKRRGEVTRGKG